VSTIEELRERIEVALRERAYVAGRVGIAIGLARADRSSTSIAITGALEDALEVCAPKPQP
jgi:hypothetical protein